jgi:hypothetical protein
MSSRASLSRSAAVFLCTASALLAGCGGDMTSPAAPDAPSNLAVQQLLLQQIDLSWSDNSDNETGFEIWSSATSSGTFALAGSVGEGVTSYSATGLQDGTQYCYRVRATGTSGENSQFTTPVCATTPVPQAPPPTAPTNLAALASSSTAIALTWDDNSSDEQGFEIWRSTTGATGAYSLLTTLAADDTTASDSGLTPSTEYCYQVRATGAGDAPPSSFTASACATTLAPPPPGTPSDLVATATSTTAVGLTWTDNSSNETGFEIWQSTTGPTGSFTLLTTTAADATSASDGSLTAGTEYCYQVRAIGTGMPQSAFSNTACATPPTPLPAPTDVTATAASTTAIDLTWTDNSSGEESFEVWRSTTGASGTYSKLTTVDANVTTANDASLTPGSQYCYKVKAIGSGIVPNSPLSSSSCATTPTPVATPTGVSATATSTTDIGITWNDNSSNESGFQIWRSTTGSSGPYSLLSTVGPNVESAADSGLDPGTQYCYKVKALGSGVIPDSPLSSSDCATTGAQVTAPSNLSASVASSTSIALSWTDNSSNESKFEIWRSTTGASGTYTLRKTVSANVESTNDTGLTSGTQYCYEVRALGSGINPASDFSNNDCATPIVVRIVLFGDSNTDRCEEDWWPTQLSSRKSSYVGVTPRLGPNDAHLSCMVAGKVESKWDAIRNETIDVVNHGIAGTTTGGNTHVTGDPDRSNAGSPNARLSVNGTTRFEAEVLGQGFPWSGGEPTNSSFPTGAITRVNAFTPDDNDFAYVSMGTNDDAGANRTLTAAQTEANLRWMAQQWIDAGHPANHFIITTLPPRDDANSATSIPDRNTLIRALASDLGLHLIDLSNHVSDDNGATWRSASLNIGDGIHYTETVRGWIADQIVSWMDSKTP